MTWGSYGGYGMGQSDPNALVRAKIAADAQEKTAQLNANAQEESAQLRSPGAIVPSGVPGQFRRVGSDVAGGHLADATVAGVSMGTPDSFNGGAGAPAPVAVMRGTKTTYTNPAPDIGNGGFAPTAGRDSVEFATPLQASQNFNRGNLADATAAALKLPDVVPPGSPAGTLSPRGQALADAVTKFGGYEATPATARDTLADAQATALKQSLEQTQIAQNRANFQQQALPALGVKNLDELKKDPEKYGLFAQHLDLAGKEGPESALTKMNDTMNYNRWKKLFTPDNVNAVRTKEGLAPAPATIFNAPAPGDAQAAAARQSMVRQYGPYFDKHLNQNGMIGTLYNALPNFLK